MASQTTQTKTIAIALRDVRKTFGSVVAVDAVNLDVFDGEFLTLLGPSGSGKTTVLRMIAGFEPLTSGSIMLNGKDVTGVPAFERDVNTVFQDYALFPHMTVLENVEYGLKVKGVARPERRNRATEILEVVQLVGFADRKPNQLSGGQRQRVALARALVNQPKVLLLDEPLGALDLKLREEMQVELKSIQQRVGITFVYVTHDQGEALSMSDRVVVFNAGKIEQVGTPREIYEHPATSFVAGFVGITNLFSGDRALQLVGRAGVFTLRPEHVQISEDLTKAGIRATITSIQYLGAECRVHCLVAGSGAVISSGPSEQT
ncbi:MAG: ABC transporter ATP-binding protein, partial [Acidimicrobiaceae bacterium]|nr:ABC transporter ATP-binding protein [Acidimicrobiaceae bacterium]